MKSAAANAYALRQALLGVGGDLMKRKGSQRGSVRSRSGSWYISYSAWLPDGNGNLKYGPVTSRVGPSRGPERLTKTEAENQGFEKFVAPANGPAKLPQGQATVQQFVELRFVPEHVAVLKKNGRVHYNHLLSRHVLPTLGSVKLADVTPSLVQRLISAKIEAGYSTQTVKHVRTATGAIFAHAKALGFWKGDLPTVSVRLPEIVHEQRQALTRDQVSLLVDALPERYRPLVLFCAYTGVRIGEALGLRWRAVNLTDDWKTVDSQAIAPNSVLIHENWTRGERTTPKKRASWRKIPLTTTAWYALMLQREVSSLAGEEQPVFAAGNGRPMDAHNIAQRHLRKAGAKVGCPWVSFHCLRHTASTLTDPHLTVAEKALLLGHSGTSMQGRYTHPQLEQLRAAMERAERGAIQ